MYRVSPFVRHFAFALLSGIGLATLWVNLAAGSYYDAIEWRLLSLSLPGWLSSTPLVVTPLSLVADGLMALFLFFVGKELWEALILERGALSGKRAVLLNRHCHRARSSSVMAAHSFGGMPSGACESPPPGL